MKTYLIQRGHIRDNENKNGIDSIVEFDYMGSSEFEYGALPNSLQHIRKYLCDYIYSNFQLNGKTITVFHSKQFSNREISTHLDYLAKSGKQRLILKEYSGFDIFINNQYTKINFWWDLDNNLMFWERDSDFECKFRVKIIGISTKIKEKQNIFKFFKKKLDFLKSFD